MVKGFLFQQAIVQYRIPINDDGTLGTPEITKKFISNIAAPKGVVKRTVSNITLEDDKEEVAL